MQAQTNIATKALVFLSKRNARSEGYPGMQAEQTATAIATAPQPPTRTTKNERQRVTARVKVACDAMVYEGLTYQEAAAKVGLHVASMRLAIERPHVIQYLKAQKDVFRASVSAGNIHHLARIRSSDNQMAALGAVKVLEQIDEKPIAANQPRAGMLIVVVQGAQAVSAAPSHQVIDVSPNDAT